MRRREFVAVIGGMATWPLGAHAQQRRLPVIGFVYSRSVVRCRSCAPSDFFCFIGQRFRLDACVVGRTNGPAPIRCTNSCRET